MKNIIKKLGVNISKFFPKLILKALKKEIIKNNKKLNPIKEKFLYYSPRDQKKLFKEILEIFFKKPVFIISYPKCGRTWLRVMLGKYICEKYNISDKLAIKVYRLTKKVGLSPTKFTHDSCSDDKNKIIDYLALPKDKSKYRNTKVVFLIRNVKDVIVSAYFQAKKRRKEFEAGLSNFIRSKEYGIKKIIRFYNIWYENRKVPYKFMLLRYEDMHKDSELILYQVLKFIGEYKPNWDYIHGASKFASFQNMKKMEKKNYFKSNILKPEDKEDKNSYKVRKGEIRGYTDYLNSEEIDYINRLIKKYDNPFLSI